MLLTQVSPGFTDLVVVLFVCCWAQGLPLALLSEIYSWQDYGIDNKMNWVGRFLSKHPYGCAIPSAPGGGVCISLVVVLVRCGTLICSAYMYLIMVARN